MIPYNTITLCHFSTVTHVNVETTVIWFKWNYFNLTLDVCRRSINRLPFHVLVICVLGPSRVFSCMHVVYTVVLHGSYAHFSFIFFHEARIQKGKNCRMFYEEETKPVLDKWIIKLPHQKINTIINTIKFIYYLWTIILGLRFKEKTCWLHTSTYS